VEGQEKYEGNHHCQQRTDVVAGTPATKDPFPDDLAINNYIVGKVKVEQLNKNYTSDTKADPSQILFGDAIPLNATGEKEVEQGHRKKLDKAKEGVTPTVGSIVAAERTCQHVRSAQYQHAGEHAALAGKEGFLADFSVCTQPKNQADNEQTGDTQNVYTACTGKYRCSI
jgi:hypothetical protein